MELKKSVNTEDYEIGVIIGRFQLDELHEGHIKMINFVFENHDRVIIFLGIPRVENTRRNPMDFATRKIMLQALYPSAVILPQKDQRKDEVWSKNLDEAIAMPWGFKKALLYGSRDSFIPHYKGVHETTELITTIHENGTAYREAAAKKIIPNKDFRKGVIYANYARRAVTYSTVDVAAYNDDGQILLAKKPNEDSWRFIGGFVDRTDISDEHAVRREFGEEANNCHISNIQYILSKQVDDWRYARGEEDGIMTRLFIGRYGFGQVKATDDVEKLKWFDLSRFSQLKYIKKDIMPEHQEMMAELVEKVYKDKLIPNLGEFYVPKEEKRDPEAVVEDTTYKPK